MQVNTEILDIFERKDLSEKGLAKGMSNATTYTIPIPDTIQFFNKDFNLILEDDKKVSPQPMVSFERIIDNEGIPIECSINYVSDNVNNHFEISIYLESKFSKDRMKWDGEMILKDMK